MAKPSDKRDEKMEALFQKRVQNPQPHQHQPSTTENQVPEPATPNGQGRKLSKSKDPAWGKFTILLKKETQLDASYYAERLDHDLSDIAEDLLSRWVSEQRQSRQKDSI